MRLIWESVIEDKKCTTHIFILGPFTMDARPEYYYGKRPDFIGPINLYLGAPCDDNTQKVFIESCHCQAYDDLEIL